jgi:autotransporter-associated beta strand protein
MPGTTTITDAGNWSEMVPLPIGFLAGPGATVDFTSAGVQTILDNNTQFFNLTHSGSGTLNFTSGPQPFLAIAGNFTNSNGTVDAQGASLVIGGNWLDTSSIVNLNTVMFVPFSPTPQTISSNSNFNNLTFNGPPPALLQLLTPVTLTGNFTVMSGTFDANGQDMTVGGNWSNGGTVENTNNVTFNGNNIQQIDNGTSTLNNLIHTGGSFIELMTHSLTITGTLTNTAGPFDVSNLNLTVGGLTTILDSLIQNSGANPATKLTFNGGLAITGGILESGVATTILGAGVSATSDNLRPATILGILDLGGANLTFTISTGPQPRDLIVLAQVTNGGIIKDGDGIMELANTNQYSGDTTINAGTLDVSQDGALGAPGQTLGPVVSTPGDPGDGIVDITGDIGNVPDPQIRVGVGGDDVAGQDDIFFFALPKLTSPASLLGAQLNFQYLGISQFTPTVTPEFNVDLFGIGARSTPTILVTDYFDGDPSLSSDSLISRGFITGSTAPGSLQASGASLLSFLQSLYGPDGTPKAAYAVFRANPDVHLPPFSLPYRGYEIASANNTDNGGAFVPKLQLTVVPQAAAGTGGTTVAAGAVLQFSNSVTYNTPEVVTLNGGTIRAEASSGTNSFAGPIFLNAAGNVISAQTGSALVLSGPINSGGSDLTVTGAGITIINGSINGTAAATLTMQGPGTLILNGANNYGGGTRVSSGTLGIGNDSAVGSGALRLADGTSILADGGDHAIVNVVTLGGVVTIGAGPSTLTFNGVISGLGSLILNGNLTLTARNVYSGPTTVNGAILTIGNDFPIGQQELILNDGSFLAPSSAAPEFSISNDLILNGAATVLGTSSLFIRGAISGTGSLTDANSEVLFLTMPSTFSGGTTVDAGFLDVGNNNGLGTGPLVLSDGTSLGINNLVTINNPITLKGTSNIQPGSTTLSGVISGTGGFTLTGGGRLRLAADNTYSGTTTVNDCFLTVTGSQPSSAVVINSGGTLAGVGTVGAVTVNSGGTLAPGQPGSPSTPGILTTGNLQFNGGTLEIAANGTIPGGGYSQLQVNGTVNLGNGVASFQDLTSRRFDYGSKFRIIDNLGTMPTSGFFAGMLEGTVTTDSAGNRLLITYQGGTGNDVVANAVPRSDLTSRVSINGQWWLNTSNGSGFTSTQPLTWSTGVTWVDVVTGDFNGDGFMDIAGRSKETGDWWVSLSNGSGGFTTSKWATWSTGATWVDVKVGDFNGDGKADITARALENGQWYTSLSNGTAFNTSLWASWSTGATWVDVKVGDFNGDGKADITARALQNGQWYTGLSSGTGFNTTLWASWSTGATWVDVQVGDFNGDGMDDITARYLQGGSWWTALSNGSGFATTPAPWAVWSTGATWVDVHVGDFNGDGKADIIGRALENGQWYVALSNGSNGIATTRWDTWSTGATWIDVQVGDFNGDGKADIIGRAGQNGQWYVGLSNGSAFSTSLWAVWSTGATWVNVGQGAFV